MPITMKAALYHTFGSVEVLRYADVPIPQVGTGDVLLRVRATGVSRLDIEAQAGELAGVTLPHIGGSECIGEIIEVGAEVKTVVVGQKVAVAPFMEDRGIFGVTRPGGFAEYAVAPATSLVPLPDDLDDTDAAACVGTMLAAWHMLVTKAGIHPGQTVLIGAAGGGVGSAAVQVATLWGTRVIATVGNAEKSARVRELGADDVIDLNTEPCKTAVMRLTDGRGADIVVDFTGAATWPDSFASVAAGGIFVTCGWFTGTQATLDIGELARKQVLVIGGRGGTKDELTEVLRLVSDGRLAAVVDRTYPLVDIAAAQTRLISRAAFGRIVLLP